MIEDEGVITTGLIGGVYKNGRLYPKGRSMTKEELYNKYNGELHDESEFFEDLSKWFDYKLKSNTVEMQKALKDKTIRKQFIRLMWRLIKGESLENLEKEFRGKHD